MANETKTQEQLEQEYQQYDELQTKFEAAYPDGFDREVDMIEAMKRFSLYCGTCGHGNGCEHGVPTSRY